MPQDEIAALNAKLDFVIGKQRELTEKMDFLQAQFNQSKGALWLLKLAVALASAAAVVWGAVHGVRS